MAYYFSHHKGLSRSPLKSLCIFLVNSVITHINQLNGLFHNSEGSFSKNYAYLRNFSGHFWLSLSCLRSFTGHSIYCPTELWNFSTTDPVVKWPLCAQEWRVLHIDFRFSWITILLAIEKNTFRIPRSALMIMKSPTWARPLQPTRKF